MKMKKEKKSAKKLKRKSVLKLNTGDNEKSCGKVDDLLFTVTAHGKKRHCLIVYRQMKHKVFLNISHFFCFRITDPFNTNSY